MAGRPNRPRALTQLSIPQTPSVGGPLSAPTQDQQGLPHLASPSTANSSAPITPQRLFLPAQHQQQQQQQLSPTVQAQSPHNATLSPASAIIQMHQGGHTMRAMPMNLPESPKPGHDWESYELPSWALATLSTEGPQQQEATSQTPAQASNSEMSGANTGFMMAPPPGVIELDFSSIPFSLDNFPIDTSDHGMSSFMGDDSLFGVKFTFDDIFDPSQL